MIHDVDVFFKMFLSMYYNCIYFIKENFCIFKHAIYNNVVPISIKELKV